MIVNNCKEHGLRDMQNLINSYQNAHYDELFEEVFNELHSVIEEHALSILSITKSSGLSRQTVQRIFNGKQVQIKSLHAMKNWLRRFEKTSIQ